MILGGKAKFAGFQRVVFVLAQKAQKSAALLCGFEFWPHYPKRRADPAMTQEV